VHIHALIPGGNLSILQGPLQIGDISGVEGLDHIAKVERDEYARNHKPVPAHPHRRVHDERGHLVPHVEVFFVADVVGSHLVHQSVEGALTAQVVVAFRLVFAQMFRACPLQVAVVRPFRGATRELSYHHKLYYYGFDSSNFI
jgi:hypothetical protein